MRYSIIPDKEALDKCAWCQGKIQEDEDVYDVSVKLKPDVDLSEFTSHCIQLDLVSEAKSVYMLVTAQDSEARKKGDDGMFLLCSESCSTSLKALLENEIARGILFESVRSDGV
jgi:hypothetical protein